MPEYKLQSFKQYSNNINESVILTLLVPVIAIAIGKLAGYTIGKFNNGSIQKSMENLSKSRFAEKANEKDIKNLYDLIVKKYPEIIDLLDSNDIDKINISLRTYGLDKSDDVEVNQVISKLKQYHINN